MAEKFNTGDIVQLLSGGPKMTVQRENLGGEILCQWFAGSKLNAGYFKPDSLIRVEDDKKDSKKD